VFNLCISFSYMLSDFGVCEVKLISNLLVKNVIKQVVCYSNNILCNSKEFFRFSHVER